ncbi:hypothetical protein [uncultured Slackia sp.]|uniref:hypothetical protein n=1 Tax=uncultured Slackia sp. TaxID=665903 RepID=UPI0026DF1565|nr:hypothetical protein [uncultured Slackia sp.]
MKLLALKSFAGTRGSAGEGQEFEVPAAVGKAMLAERYPVKEVASEKAKRASSKRPARASSDSAAMGD